MDKYCPECGSPLYGGENYCGNCGTRLHYQAPQQSVVHADYAGRLNDTPVQSVPYRPQIQQQIIIKQRSGTNGAGCAGFTFALFAIFSSFIPIVNFLSPIFAGLGAIFSFIGLFFRPRALAIVGLLLSLSGLIIVLSFAGLLAGLVALS